MHTQDISTSTKATTDLLEQDFAHFGYPHTIVTDNASSFKSEEFQQWCRERGIVNLSGAPYHPATNGAAERLVQSFKQALRKSSAAPNPALQEFLMHYRRTPLDTGYSPSQLLEVTRRTAATQISYRWRCWSWWTTRDGYHRYWRGSCKCKKM